MRGRQCWHCLIPLKFFPLVQQSSHHYSYGMLMQRESERGKQDQCREWVAGGLTVEVDVSVGQGQQRGVQWVVGVPEDGVPLVNLLHDV